MKTKFSKLIFLPALVFTFAIASAFTTNAMHNSKAKTMAVQGWIQHPGAPCTISAQCSDVVNVICTAPVSGIQLFAKDATGDCPTKLYRPK